MTTQTLIQLLLGYLVGHSIGKLYTQRPTKPTLDSKLLDAAVEDLIAVKAELKRVEDKLNELAASTTEAISTIVQQNQ